MSSKSKEVEKKLKIAKSSGLSKADMVDMLRNIYLSRLLDDAEITMKKQMKAFFQISGAGHEGVLTAVGRVLKPKYDYAIPYYRDRALCLALGVTPYEMLCQANGNVGDTASHGRQMPSHWGNVQLNIVSKSSCTGTQFLQACGMAEAGIYFKQLKDEGIEYPENSFNADEIIYVSSGEGTTSQGEFWEGISTACLNKLPVLFMVEDNGYAISVPVSQQTPGGSISKALNKFPGLKILVVNGNCPIESYAAAKEAERHLRSGKGPVLMHASVTRPYSHSLSDDHSTYRSKDELSEEAKNDVFISYGQFLVDAKVVTKTGKQKILDVAAAEVKKATAKALETPWPEVSESLKHLYSESVDITSKQFETLPMEESDGEKISIAIAVNKTLKTEIRREPRIRIFGQDVADFGHLEKLDDASLKGKGGVFKVTSGVQRVARPNQVFNSALAEANIVGRAIGMALRGLKPVVEIQFFDYIWTAFMQIKNELATFRYRSGGDFKCPIVIRVPTGGYLKGGSLFHSQSGESFFTHIPGLRVAMPSTARDAVGLLRTSIRSDDPVIFLEHKHLYYQGYNRDVYPGDDYMIPFGKAKIVKEGSDATIVCWGAMVNKSLEAAKLIESSGVSVEIIDLRTLAPMDMVAIKKSLAKTSRVLIAHEETKTSGLAGEISARINEECFESLDAPIMRVAAKDTHVAYCPRLEEDILPQISDVHEMLEKLLDY